LSEDFDDLFRGVRGWQLEHPLVEVQVLYPDPYWADFFRWVGAAHERAYDILQSGIDPFIGALKSFFQNIYDWVHSKWGQLWSWISDISAHIGSLWRVLEDSIYAL